MSKRKTETNSPNKKRISPKIAALVAVLIIIAAVSGVLVGNLIFQKRASAIESARVDEFVGLGKRTGLTGDLELQVKPMSLSVRPGASAPIRLTLTNKSKQTLVLNNWLEALPSSFQNNQFPIKVVITRNGMPVNHIGNPILRPPHIKSDFFQLGPGKSREVEVDLTSTANRGKWEMSRPGVYRAEIWYESYLSGRYIGVRAWTGMSNHAVIQVNVSSPK